MKVTAQDALQASSDYAIRSIERIFADTPAMRNLRQIAADLERMKLVGDIELKD